MYISIPKFEVQSQETPIFFGQKYTKHFISHMAKVVEPSMKKWQGQRTYIGRRPKSDVPQICICLFPSSTLRQRLLRSTRNQNLDLSHVHWITVTLLWRFTQKKNQIISSVQHDVFDKIIRFSRSRLRPRSHTSKTSVVGNSVLFETGCRTHSKGMDLEQHSRTVVARSGADPAP